MSQSDSIELPQAVIQESGEIRRVPVDRIRVINPRVRNRKVFASIVDSIATIGLKRPITVSHTGTDEGGPRYDLVCGQGRLEAFQNLGEKEIPCIVVQASEADRYLMSLVENLARRKHSNAEPLAVHPEPSGTDGTPRYSLLDGHLRFEALRAINAAEAHCLLATDDEGFTYNRRISRLSAIQEHRMILKAIERKVPPERIALALNVNVERIRARQRMLDGIAPEVVALLKDRMVSHGIFGVLRRMKPIRQIEAAEMMISANRYTENYARMVLVATRPELLVEGKRAKAAEATTPEDIARMEREMERLQQDHRVAEDTLGETMLVLVVAKGYLARLMRNEAVSGFLSRHHPDLSAELTSVMEAVGTDARSIARE